MLALELLVVALELFGVVAQLLLGSHSIGDLYPEFFRPISNPVLEFFVGPL